MLASGSGLGECSTRPWATRPFHHLTRPWRGALTVVLPFSVVPVIELKGRHDMHDSVKYTEAASIQAAARLAGRRWHWCGKGRQRGREAARERAALRPVNFAMRKSTEGVKDDSVMNGWEKKLMRAFSPFTSLLSCLSCDSGVQKY